MATDRNGRHNVLFIPTWYPSAENPTAGTFVREHARAVSLYDDVTVLYVKPLPLSSGRARFSWHEEFDENIRTIRVALPRIAVVGYTLGVLEAYRRLVRRGYRPDIIHAHVFLAGAPAALLGKVYRTPVVVTEHYTGFPRRTISWVRVWQARLAFILADKVMPVSASLQRAIQAYGIKAKFQVVPNAVDTALFSPSPGRGRRSTKRLLFVGLLDPSHKKGIPTLLRALSELRQQREDWQLDIVGDGPARPGYEMASRELGIGDKVVFHGLKAKSEVATFMNDSDVFVLPSVWENAPCVLAEAAASGLPIVSTLTGGIPEMVDEDSGVLVPPEDAPQLAAALERVIGSISEYDTERIARKAQRYSYESVGGAIHGVYGEYARR